MSIIYLFTNIAPLYRRTLWKLLLEVEKDEFHFYSGINNKLGIQLINFEEPAFKSYENRLNRIRNIWLQNKILIWQKGVLGPCFKDKFNFAIFLGEMYCLSTWIAAIICRFRGIKIIFWGHGIYGNEGILKLFFRKIFYGLASKHLLYERRAKRIMTKYGFNPDNLFVVFNSLAYDEHKKLRKQYQQLTKQDVFPFFKNPTLPVLVFIGRLTTIKKLELLLQAVIKININEPKINLVIIGDGPERANLEIIGRKMLYEECLYFTGACYKEEEIGRYLSSADLCVSPGNVGLTAIHSLSFGTPVCTHSNLKKQMPEAETIINGYNGFYFEENNVDDIIKKIKYWLKNNTDRKMIRQRCYEIIDQYYNPNYQLTVFNRMTNNEKPEV